MKRTRSWIALALALCLALPLTACSPKETMKNMIVGAVTALGFIEEGSDEDEATEILAEAELNRTFDAETLRRLEQETRIEEAKVLINSQNVFMAESQIEGVLSDPVDEIIEAAASDCFGMMRMSMKDYGEAITYFRRAIDLYEVHLMRRKAMAGRARLMAALALGEDHVSARRMEGEMETFVRQRGDRFRYTGNLVSRFIRRIHRGPRRSCCHGSCGRMSTSSSRGPRRSMCRGPSPAPPGC